MTQERERGITITAASVSVYWQPKIGKYSKHEHQINVIDTPGHIDFTIEVNRSLRVLDGAVVVLESVSGVQPQTETNWRLANMYKVPRMVFINKMDREGANYLRAVKQIKERLGASPVITQLPIGSSNSFVGLIDLTRDKALIYKGDDLGASWDELDVTNELLEEIIVKHNLDNQFDREMLRDWNQYRNDLHETVAALDEDAIEQYFENGELDYNTLIDVIRKGTISNEIVPVLCGSSFKNKGVQPLMDAVVNYLPAPTDVEAIKCVVEEGKPEMVRKSSDDEPFAALAFKIISDPHGVLTFARVYSGKAKKGDQILNSVTGKKERIGRIVEMHADKRQELDEIYAGDIVAFVGMKEAHTGDTLCTPDEPCVLERMNFPDPVISIAVEPKTKDDRDKMGTGLGKLVREDPSLRIETDQETGQAILSGMGELHLDIIIDRLKREFNCEVNTGNPKVAYRETITGNVQHREVHRKQSGGSGQFADIEVIIEPLERGEGFQFEDKITGGSIPREFIPAIKSGFEQQKETGVLLGYPTIDFKVQLVFGSFHSVDSNANAFEICAKTCFREAMKKAKPVLLEPIMKVEVISPPDYLGDIMGDISRRRGMIQSQDVSDTSLTINCTVPLSEMFGYATKLRGMSQGRATFTMELDHYDTVPNNVLEELKTQLA